MATRHSLALFLVTLGVAASFGLASASAGLTGALEAYRVVITDQGVEEFLPADNARPADVIEYRLVYSNTGDDPIQNVLITDPIPIGTTFIHPSASRPEAGRVDFSVDGGKSFHAWPVMVKVKAQDGEEKVVEATPDMVTHVRWELGGAIPPEGEVRLKSRTVIK
jgi:uncharacterized repeat protein (TIGR01451 family)